MGLLILLLSVARPLFSLVVELVLFGLLTLDLGYAPSEIWHWRRWPLVFLGLSVLTMAVQVGVPQPADSLIWEWHLFSLSADSVRAAGNVFCRVFAAISCLFFLARTVEMPDFMDLLARWRLPQIFINMMYLIYRQIFGLRQRFHQIIEAQQLRQGYHSLRRGIPALGLAMGAVFSSLFMRSRRMAEAMDLRLFRDDFSFPPQDYQEDRGLSLKLLGILLLLALGGLVLRLSSEQQLSPFWRWLLWAR